MGMGFADLAPRLGVDSEWEVFGFEPNVYAYNAYNDNIESERYDVLNNKNIILAQKAVWNKDENIMFCHEAVNEEHYNENPGWKRDCDLINEKYESGEGLDFIDFDLPATGGSCVEEMRNQLQKPPAHAIKLTFKETSEIEAFDFSKWTLDNFDRSDYIVLKMDIEGSEYRVLQKMIEDASIDYIDHLYIEWHHRYLPQEYADLTLLLCKYIKSRGVKLHEWS